MKANMTKEQTGLLCTQYYILFHFNYVKLLLYINVYKNKHEF